MPAKPVTRTPQETLAELRLKLLRWESNLTANVKRYDQDNYPDSARIARAQLGVVRDVFDIIGK